MKNIAIIIGISKYQENNINDLDACENDAKEIKSIIDKSKKYDSITFFCSECSNNEILSKLEEIKMNYENEEIGEIFLYFSGHGHTLNDDFYYITSNTENDKINTTALKNSDIDSLFRNLNPSLYVKVVDACHSGVSYIKGFSENSQVQSAISKTSSTFKKCFFMFSSMSSQPSFVMTDNRRSEFTNSFLKALQYYENKEKVKYSELSNYMSDYFISKEKQTPFFVLQTDMLDIFVNYNQELREYLKELFDVEEKNGKIDESEEDKLEMRISKKIENCATKDEAKRFVDSFINEFHKYDISKSILKSYYKEERIIDGDISDIPQKKSIATWICDNKKELGLFVKADLEEKRKNILYSIQSLSNQFSNNEKEEDYLFSITESDLHNNIRIVYTPQKLGIQKYELNIIIIPSFTKIYIFYTYAKNMPINWEQFVYDGSDNWTIKSFNIKTDLDLIETTVKDIYNNFTEYCLKELDKLL